MMLMRFIYVVTIMLLTGCASMPQNLSQPVLKDEGVALLFTADEKPRHTHIGTTVFQNFNNTDLGNKSYGSIILSQLQSLIKKNSPLSTTVVTTDDLNTTEDKIFDSWSGNLSSELQATVDSISKDMGFDYLLIISESSYVAWSTSTVYLEGYGLYTRCIFGGCTYAVLDQLSMVVYSVKEQTIIGSFPYKPWRRPSLSDLSTPSSPKEVDDSYIGEAADRAIFKFIELSEKYLKEIGLFQ